MNSVPRKLRLLIIDDELKDSFGGYLVPQSIEVVKLGENLRGIDSWEAALQFWTSFHHSEVPDLVVADVRFIDDSSPLSALLPPDENYIPTGLSHLKVFGVLSRALGKPIGVCVRTIDPRVWEDHIATPRPEDPALLENWLFAKAMGYLAVHEIGELAAILGDGKAILSDTRDKQQHIRNCHEWLRENSETTFEDGVRKAVRDYRRSLFRLVNAPGTPSVFVRPEPCTNLMGWCERMRKTPQPLDSKQDIGLELTYHNGNHDLISLASLFADFERITTKALEPVSFTVAGRSSGKPWSLDHNGRPKIGTYLYKLGSLTAACEEAALAVEKYDYSYPLPDHYHRETLATIKSGGKHPALTAGLMVLFQFVRIEQKKVEEWKERFEYYHSWDPRNTQFVTSADERPTNTLKRALEKLIELIPNFLKARLDNEDVDQTKPFTRVELFDELPNAWVKKIDVDGGDHNDEWVKWHFERLVDAQVLTHKVEDAEDYYTLNSAWRKGGRLAEPPPAPHSFPKVVQSHNGKAIQREPKRIQQLRMSLGYKEDDYNSVERVLADAFGGLGKKSADSERVKTGRAILDDFKAPSLPFFLLDLCRYYARKYRDWPPDKWPMWMRVPSDTAADRPLQGES
jgi:hypothetical protein